MEKMFQQKNEGLTNKHGGRMVMLHMENHEKFIS